MAYCKMFVWFANNRKVKQRKKMLSRTRIVPKISSWAQKLEVYLAARSLLRASEKRKELDEKRKQLEETRHDRPQEKEVASAGAVMSSMTAKLKGTLMQIWISLYVRVHIKTILWKFRILTPKNSRVIFPWNL